MCVICVDAVSVSCVCVPRPQTPVIQIDVYLSIYPLIHCGVEQCDALASEGGAQARSNATQHVRPGPFQAHRTQSLTHSQRRQVVCARNVGSAFHCTLIIMCRELRTHAKTRGAREQTRVCMWICVVSEPRPSLLNIYGVNTCLLYAHTRHRSPRSGEGIHACHNA